MLHFESRLLLIESIGRWRTSVDSDFSSNEFCRNPVR